MYTVPFDFILKKIQLVQDIMSTLVVDLEIGQEIRIKGQWTCTEKEITNNVQYWYKATIKNIDDDKVQIQLQHEDENQNLFWIDNI